MMAAVIALVSPAKNAYSETFIQAHKNLLTGRVCYYYGGYFPNALEGASGSLPLQMGILKRASTWVAQRLLGRGYEYTRNEALKASFVKEGVNVVLAEFGPTAAHVLNVCKECHLPLIVHFHGYDANVNSVVLEYEEIYADVFDYAAGIVAVSRDMKERLVALGADPAKITLTACAPNEKFFGVEASYSNKNFLSIGRFVDKKAPYYTIIAFSEVLKVHPDAHLYLIGDGPLFNMSHNIVRWLDISDNVHFLGAVGHEKIADLFSEIIAYVQHSITADNGDKEGTPVAILEAGAAGVCVISTRHAGIQEVVIDQVTGFLVDEHDVQGMSDRMKRVLENPCLAERMGSEARERVRSHFSMEIHIATLDEVVSKALKAPRVESAS